MILRLGQNRLWQYWMAWHYFCSAQNFVYKAFLSTLCHTAEGSWQQCWTLSTTSLQEGQEGCAGAQCCTEHSILSGRCLFVRLQNPPYWAREVFPKQVWCFQPETEHDFNHWAQSRVSAVPVSRTSTSLAQLRKLREEVGQSGKSQVFLFPSVKSSLLWEDWLVDKVQRDFLWLSYWLICLSNCIIDYKLITAAC